MVTRSIDILLVICVKDRDSRGNLVRVTTSVNQSSLLESWGVSSLEIREVSSLEIAHDTIQSHFCMHPESAVILLSDSLLYEDDDWLPEWRSTSACKELNAKFANSVLLQVAIDKLGQPINDVALVLTPDFQAQQWKQGFQILCQRIRYYLKPKKAEIPPKCEMRAIETQSELRDALRLRYDVYQIMGYLPNNGVSPRGLDLTWCDLLSNHFGAFVRDNNGAEKLVGTARLIMNRYSNDLYKKHALSIARTNQSLKSQLDQQRSEMAQFQLPIFQTLPINDHMRRCADSRFAWAELSRVVVHPEYRGANYASQLLEAVMDFAESFPIEVVLLECLHFHESLYAKFGFSSLGLQGPPMGVGRTMIGMQWQNTRILSNSSGR